MENNFFMPVGKPIEVTDTNNIIWYGKFEGFIQFGGIPSIYMINDLGDTSKMEIIIPINQVVNFNVIKPKTILL